MKHYLRPVFALFAFGLLTSGYVFAETGENMVIALQTDDFELAETDISSLAIGEAKTIETESGKVIDILRTNDGAEIYVDGELLEMNFTDDNLHVEHMMEEHVEIVCDNEEECDENIIVLSGDRHEASEWVMADGEHVTIHSDIEITCDDEDGDDCSHEMILISEDGEIDLEDLHEEHGSGEAHKRIVIKRVQVTED